MENGKRVPINFKSYSVHKDGMEKLTSVMQLGKLGIKEQQHKTISSNITDRTVDRQ